MSDTKLYSCGVPLIFFSLTSHPYNLKFCYPDFWVAPLKNSFNALYSYTCVCSSGESCMQPSADAFFSVCKQTTGSLYFWAAHLAGPVWGPLASWCCAWLEAIGLIAGIGTQVCSSVYSRSRHMLEVFFKQPSSVLARDFVWSLLWKRQRQVPHFTTHVSFQSHSLSCQLIISHAIDQI